MPTDDPTPPDDEGSDVLPSEDDASTSPEPTTVTVGSVTEV